MLFLERMLQVASTGVFTPRSAPTIVATLLEVSRFTIYNDLHEAKARRTKGKSYSEEEKNDAHS